MEKYLPASFLESLGGGLAIIAVIAGIASLFPSTRAHNLRMMAILIISSVSLFSNSVSTYLVAMFVIATAVTEIEFLQTLAAIISGNKDYFDLKKEALSTENKLSNLADEVKRSVVITESVQGSTKPKDNASEGVPVTSTAVREATLQENKVSETKGSYGQTPDLKSSDELKSKNEPNGGFNKVAINEKADGGNFIMAFGDDIELARKYVERIYGLEAKAFDKLEVFYSRAIERGIRLRRAEKSIIVLDGLLSQPDKGEDIAFEVKYLRSARNFISWTKMVSQQVNSIRVRYKEVTRKEVYVHFVLILEKDVKLTIKQRESMRNSGADYVSVFTAEYLEDGVENAPWVTPIPE